MSGADRDTNATPLRLRAVDAADLAILSTCLQDALILVADLNYERAEGRFVALTNRFRWEAGERTRVRSALIVDQVVRVQVRGIDLAQRERFLPLLALQYLVPERTIELAFSGGGAIRLEVSGILCHLQDLGEPWPAAWTPHHEQEP